jgi:hypothetical protein
VPTSSATVTDHIETFDQTTPAMEAFMAKQMVSSDMFVRAFASKSITLSSEFSGIGFFDAAAAIMQNSVNAFLRAHTEFSIEKKFVVKPLHFVEVDAKCRAELLRVPYTDGACIHRDILEFLPPALRETFENAGSDAAQRAFLPSIKNRIRTQMYCERHDRVCKVGVALVHSGGSPCVDFSAFGALSKEDGAANRLYLLWMLMHTINQESLVYHENVKSFGRAKLTTDLSEWYVPIHLVLDGCLFGVAAKRERFWSLFVHKRHVVVKYGGKHLFTASFFYHTMRETFFRKCGYTEFGLLINDSGFGKAQVADEVRWASLRPSVIARRNDDDDMWEDSKLSVFSCLTGRERASVSDAMSMHLSGIFDTSQNFSARARVSKQGRLMTLVKHTGALIAWDWTPASDCACGALGKSPPETCGSCYRGKRPVRGELGVMTCLDHGRRCCPECFDTRHAATIMTAKECLSTMGMPVTLPQIAQTGVASSFADEILGPPPAGRTRASMAHKLGTA